MADYDAGWIAEAILTNRCIDGSRSVLEEAQRAQYKPFVPPIAIPAREERAAAPTTPPAGAEEAIDRPTLTIGEFENLSRRARKAFLDGGGDHGFPTLQAEEVLRAIAAVAEKIDFDEAGGHRMAAPEGAPQLGQERDDPPVMQRLLSRRGLQIVGCWIKGDLVLVNARLPFSVRLIGCVVDGSIVVDHCALTTLDLSGSVVRGLHGAFLNAGGSVRMRRTVSTGPVDLGGARIRGLVDGTDCVVLPFHPPPNSEVFVGDRGVFNLSLARLENELHLDRSRIYGGLNLKGATIQRSVFMERAILLSPLGVVERLLTEQAVKLNEAKDPRSRFVGQVTISSRCREEFDVDFRLSLWVLGIELDEGQQPTPEQNSDLALESARLFLLRFDRRPVLSRLMGESMRATTVALRGDGVVVEGSIFARRINAIGRFRMKYAGIGGSVHLNGAILTSAHDIDENLHAPAANGQKAQVGYHKAFADDPDVQDLVLMRHTDMAKSQRDAGERTPDALDLRESKISGQLTLGRYEGSSPQSARLRGVIALSGARISDHVSFRGATFEGASDVRGAEAAVWLIDTYVGGEVNFRESEGIWGVSAARLEAVDGVSFADKVVRLPSGRWPTKPAQKAKRLRGKLDFTNARFGNDATFLFEGHREGVGVVGGPSIDLQHAEIEGRLSILPATANYQMDPKAYTTANIRAAEERDTIKRQLRHDRVRYREVRPQLDLRYARAKVISHPPSAWPAVGGLLVAGFRYEGYRGIGPLVVEDDLAQEEYSRAKGFPVALVAALLFMVPWFLILVHDTPSVWPQIWPQMMRAAAPVANAAGQAGKSNVEAMIGLVVLSCLAWWLRGRAAKVQPMAIHWLGRQRMELPPQRKSAIWPLEPYVRAARTLRAAGDHVAANRVELERLRLREQMQDFWPFILGKIYLWSVDWIAGYGYALGRTVVAVAGVVLLASCFFQYANKEHYLVPSRELGGRPHFSSLVYAADLVVPIMGLGNEGEWRIAQVCKRPENYACDADPEDKASLSFFSHLIWAFRAAGLALCSIIAAAITARIESMFAKIED